MRKTINGDIRCKNPKCSSHRRHGCLLIKAAEVAAGEIKCPRCGFYNRFETGPDGKVVQTVYEKVK